MDLLHHEMLKTALFRCLCIPLNFRCLLLDLVTIEIIKMRFTRSQLCKLKVADIINIAGIFQDCRNIRSHIGLTVCNTNDHRTVLARHPDFARIVTEHQLKSIGATDTNHRLCNGIDRTQIILFIIVVHQFDDYFGVRLAVERISVLQQLFLQLGIVFNDTVMHTDNL